MLALDDHVAGQTSEPRDARRDQQQQTGDDRDHSEEDQQPSQPGHASALPSAGESGKPCRNLWLLPDVNGVTAPFRGREIMLRTAGDDTIVVGGGLAGLTAAAVPPRPGAPVTVPERAAAPGGRAATRESNGFYLNLGAHALYRGGHGSRVLDELGVARPGGVPKPSGAYALDRGMAHALPGGFVSLLTTGLFGLAAKLE